MDEVDEAEIFAGKENTLLMTQTYTREFQCRYMLQRYPFDTQVDRKVPETQDQNEPVVLKYNRIMSQSYKRDNKGVCHYYGC